MRTKLALALALTAVLGACEESAPRPPHPPPVPLVDRMAPVDPARTIPGTLLVAGMTCSGCEYNVTSALRLVDGVLEAEADHASGEVQVRFDPSRTTLIALADAVRTTGYVVASPAKAGE